MSALGLEVLDRTVQETNRWLKEIMEELETDDRQEAYHALRSVLFAIRDRIPAGLSSNISSQLPLLVRGIYYEGYKHTEQPKTYRNRSAWNEEVSKSFDAAPTLDPEQATRAVFSVLSRNTSEGAVKKLFNALPEDVRQLWPGVTENVAQN